MPFQKAIDGIGEAGQALLRKGFAAGRTAAFLAQALKDETGDELSERTVAREAALWRADMDARKARRQRYADFLAEVSESKVDGPAMIRALAMQAMEENEDALMSADPIKLQTLQLDAKKVELKEREIAVPERVAAIDERKMALLEEREQRAIKLLRAEGGERQMSAEERIAEIRSIYGIAG